MELGKQKRVSFQTVGCRLNQYETERIAARLHPFGFKRVHGQEAADLYIINTCTVTHRADSDCRYLIRRAVRQNPNSRIVVVGCYVENEPERLAAMDGVDVLINNQEKEAIVEILSQKLPEFFTSPSHTGSSSSALDFHERNRAWMKISDGCNQRCSFCIITKVRGNLVNRPASEIIEEINVLVEHGFNEVVLTGVNMGYYKDPNPGSSVKSLAGLCRLILSETDIARIRLSSIEPQAVTDELIDVFAASKGRICRHFHLPLQSGSQPVLKRMRRPYTPEKFLERASKLKEAVENTIIGADVIVGFPGETDEDFERSIEVCRSGAIDYLHVFSYSDRPGTEAAEMPDKINPNVIKERNVVLTRISNELRFRSHQRQIGKTLEFIAEHKQAPEGFYWGISDNYLRVKLPLEVGNGKEIVKVKITAAFPEHMEGKPLG